MKRIIPIIIVFMLFSCRSSKKLSTNYQPSDYKGTLKELSVADIDKKTDSDCIGFVIDSDLKEEIPYVTIILSNDNNKFNTFSDFNGYFEFLKIPGGTYEIKLLFVGYFPFKDTILLENGKSKSFKIHLNADQVTF